MQLCFGRNYLLPLSKCCFAGWYPHYWPSFWKKLSKNKPCGPPRGLASISTTCSRMEMVVKIFFRLILYKGLPHTCVIWQSKYCSTFSLTRMYKFVLYTCLPQQVSNSTKNDCTCVHFDTHHRVQMNYTGVSFSTFHSVLTRALCDTSHTAPNWVDTCDTIQNSSYTCAIFSFHTVQNGLHTCHTFDSVILYKTDCIRSIFWHMAYCENDLYNSHTVRN